MIKNKSIFIEIILLVFFKLLLDYSYTVYISPVWHYSGFLYDFSISKYLLGWIVFCLANLLLYYKRHVYIYEIYFFIFLLYIIPNIVYFSLSNQDLYSFIILMMPWFVIVFATVNKEIIKIPNFKYAKSLLIVFSTIAVLSVLIHYMISTDGHIVFNFLDVYDFREKYGAKSSEGFFGYLNNWSTKVLVVFLLAYSISKKKYMMVFLFALIILLFFAFSGNKIALMGLIIVPFFYIYFNISNRKIIFLLGFLLLILVSLIMFFNTKYSLLPSLVLRRTLFTPVYLNYIYIDFFSTNNFVCWSNGIFKSFVDYHPYEKNPAYVIGDFLARSGMAANTGFISSGYMHLGYTGVVIYTILASIMFNIINILLKNTDKFIAISILFIPIYTMFISSDLLTSLLTHGLALSIIILWLLRDAKYDGLLNKKDKND